MTVDQSLFARYGLVVPALVILAVCLVVAAYVRVHNAHSLVFVSDDRVELLGVDSYFHLRHAERLVDTMPHVERRDMGTHFPRGMVDNATGLFGLSIAAAAKLTSPDDEMTTVHVARVAAWAPVIFGVLSYVLVFIVGWLVRGPIAAATATLLYLALGYPFNRTCCPSSPFEVAVRARTGHPPPPRESPRHLRQPTSVRSVPQSQHGADSNRFRAPTRLTPRRKASETDGSAKMDTPMSAYSRQAKLGKGG